MVVRLSGVGWSISFDKAVEVTNADQFLYFILKCFVFVCGVAVITVILAVFGHIHIRGIRGFAWGWYEIHLECFIEEP